MRTEHNTLALTNHAAELARLNSLTAGLVMNARNNGASWAEIGAALGTTKQAAQQRYTSLIAAERDQNKPDAWDDPPAAMLEAEATLTEADVAGPSVTPSIFLEPTDKRPAFKLAGAGTVNGHAAPGTGKGPHTCPRCGANNHKSGNPDTYRAYLDCRPTKYDPQDITDQLNTTGLRLKK